MIMILILVINDVDFAITNSNVNRRKQMFLNMRD